MKYKDVPIYERKIIGRRGFLTAIGMGVAALALPAPLLLAATKPEDVLIGYTGSMEYDAGYFYCPYIPVMTYKCENYGDSSSVMGFNTRYGHLTLS